MRRKNDTLIINIKGGKFFRPLFYYLHPMKYRILMLCLLFFGSSYADGLDEVTVFVNGKEVMRITERSGVGLKLDSLKIGDTLEFKAWTDWSNLFKATLSMKSEGLPMIELKQYPKREYGAHFRIIVDEQFLKQKTEFVLHYNDGPVASWPFAFTN
jgi:hypothetical protein